uniref:Methionine aminopeptidase n=1 Tax=Parascaris equorum TaxID=6256 RepID=A0A914S8Q8_PAREQ
AAKLRCPTCIKLHLSDSYFCSQECFKENWFTGTLRPAPQGIKRAVPVTIQRPDYALHPNGVSLEERSCKKESPKVLNDEEIEGMRTACRLAREVLDEAARICAPGVTTDEIDRVVHEACIQRECYPSPLGYYRFPKSVCTSVNEVICHGIPDLRPLENGDICNGWMNNPENWLQSPMSAFRKPLVSLQELPLAGFFCPG